MPSRDTTINPHVSRRVRERDRIVILPPPSSEKVAWTGRGR